MKLLEEIITDRLILRKSSLEEIDFYFTCGINPSINRYMSWLAPKDKLEVKKMLESMNYSWEHGNAYNYTIFRKTDEKRVGTIEPILAEYKASIGYVITPENWGNGYATEAFKGVMKNVLEDKNIRRFWTVCDVENPASARVMQKCGLELEGILRKWRPSPNISSEPRDVFCYSFIR